MQTLRAVKCYLDVRAWDGLWGSGSRMLGVRWDKQLSHICSPIPPVGEEGPDMFPQSPSALSTSAGRKHGWVENETFNQLCGVGGGVNLWEHQSWAKGGGWTSCSFGPGARSFGFLFVCFLPRCITEL